ncbi:DUF3987 domain-containing protein [Polaribacter glomeratus]|uniref:DUF3987 domain-containing protein n=1 Tax=Polaribacter glomeratus TaxID=102 RepID=A0A2S7WZF3_9FLAO|nr:DUF3987 domain-containing protein [Polaribacter glomeratus]PQJ82791.1 hypothetical protein BTO16_09460 [Polaribacter glomeratus]TXD65332.1 DUF3987 domain-containing protein [Polaribacter glomeratus]
MINSKGSIERKLDELILTQREKSILALNKILVSIPPEYSDLINEAFIYKRVPKEYLLSAMLFSVSTSMGLTFFIESLGYKNYANLYFTIVGSRGDTKSEALKLATSPLVNEDDESYDNYCSMVKDYNSEVDDEPTRKQILLQNSTIEAVHKTHSENPNAVGIYIDEVYTLIEKMGNSNSRDGVEWRTFLLQGYTNAYVDVGRKTTKSFRIKETYPNLLGGIQNEFVPKLFANGNLESGFIDRQLFTPKLVENNKLIRGVISKKVVADYNLLISNILQYKNQSEKKEEIIKKFKIDLTEQAEDRMFEYTQELINRKETAGKILKEYHAKMQISIHKLSLVLHLMKISKDMDYTKKLDLETVELAIIVNEYFLCNFKIILNENYHKSSNEPSLDEIIKTAIKNNALQKSVVDITKVPKGTVSKHWNKILEKQETGNQNSKLF